MEQGGLRSFLFFFQAEDGIRDIGVTGVQTCALPIWEAGGGPPAPAGPRQTGAAAMQSPAVTVNGRSIPLDGATPHTTGLDWLRAQGLVGCKEGCAEGECGACSVLVARPGRATPTRWTALNACLVPIAAFAGQELVTAEGLGTPDALHPVQREMAERGGSQCGYCTPGFVCSMAAEYYRPDRSEERRVGKECRSR